MSTIEEEEECARMLDHLQQYVSHLEKLIKQLKDPKKQNRELQLHKLEGLHSMITDRRKKLKLDTLKKCEDVILKILQKVNPNIVKQLNSAAHNSACTNMTKFTCKTPPNEKEIVPPFDTENRQLQAARGRLHDITTPASPSPPRDTPLLHSPIVIPTEKIKSNIPAPSYYEVNNWDNSFNREKQFGFKPNSFVDEYKTEKPDIYSKAAKSLSSAPPSKGVVFDRLGSRVDMSKPPLSAEDLKLLSAPNEREVVFSNPEDLSMGELEDLRNVIQMKLSKPVTKHKLNLPDLRNKLKSKEREKSEKANEVVSVKVHDDIKKPDNKARSPRIEIVIKEPDSMFGNLLSSIDNKLLGDKTKDKKEHKIRIILDKDRKELERKGLIEKKDKGIKIDKKLAEKEKEGGELTEPKEDKKEPNEPKKQPKEVEKVLTDDKKVLKKDPREASVDKEPKGDKSEPKGVVKVSKGDTKVPKADKKEHKDAKKEVKSDKKDHDKKEHKSDQDKKKSHNHRSSSHSKDKEISKSKSSHSTKPKETVKSAEKQFSHSDDSEDKDIGLKSPTDSQTFKRLADKYNPRPRKNSIDEVVKIATQTESRVIFDKNIAALDGIFPKTHIPSFSDPRKESFNFQPPQFNQPRAPPHVNQSPHISPHVNQLSNISMLNNQLPNMSLLANQSTHMAGSRINQPQHHVAPLNQPHIIPHAGNQIQHVGNQIPAIINYKAANSYHQQHIPTHISTVRSGNTIMNNFIIQNSNNINTSQINNHMMPFHQNTPSKAFHPYDPIDSNNAQNEYDLSKMQPVDFYSPNFKQTVPQPVPSPPSYAANKAIFNPRDPRHYGNRPLDPRKENDPRFDPRKENEVRFDPRIETEVRFDPRIETEVRFDPRIESEARFDPRKESEVRFDPRKENEVRFDPRKENEVRFEPRKENEARFESRIENEARFEPRIENEARFDPRKESEARFDPRKEKEARFDPRKESEEARFDPRNESEMRFERPNDYRREEQIRREDPRNRQPPRRHSMNERPKFGKKNNDPRNKYDSLYSNLKRQQPRETFTSPLDMLYSSNNTQSQKVGKGYGFQKFRIPKKKKPKVAIKNEEDMSPKLEEIEINQDFKIKQTDEVSLNEKSELETEIPDLKKCETAVAEKESKEEKVAVAEDKIEPASIASTSDHILQNFITTVIQSSDQNKLISAILSSFVDTVSEKQKKTIKRLRRIIESDSEGDAEETKDDKAKKEDTSTESTSILPEDEIKPKAKPDEPLKEIEDEPEEEPEDEPEEGEIEETQSVEVKPPNKRKTKTEKAKIRKGKYLKRKRAMQRKKRALRKKAAAKATPTVTKKKKCRTELDMLHEDIKEMFIRDGVLTASGKRVCRILKEGNDNVPETKAKEEVTTDASDSPKRRARDSNPKVVIEKTDLSKHLHLLPDSDSDNEIITRSTRSKEASVSLVKLPSKRIKKKPNYKEDPLDDDEEPIKEEESVEPEPETVSNTASPVLKKSGKRKRRGHSWAIGMIPKKVVKKKRGSTPSTPVPPEDDQSSIISEPEEADTDVKNSTATDYVEPDKNYYIDVQEKSECKLCPFKGRMIIQHYKNVHPDHEVLISRLAPQVAKEAINESIEKGYNEFEIPTEAVPLKKRQKYTYQCRFCCIFLKNETSDYFFDHLTSHTGEYRFVCNFCHFKTANNKSLRSHMHSSHHSKIDQIGTITPLYPTQPDYKILFAYICEDCNFVQINKSLIENHIKIYHLGDNTKIYKINLSMIVAKDKDVKRSPSKESESFENEAETPTEEVENIENERTPTPAKEIENTDDQSPAFEEPEVESRPPPLADIESIVMPTESLTKNNQIPSVVRKSFMDVPSLEGVTKSSNSIFKLDENLDDIIQGDDNKHEKMLEIDKTVRPKKSYNFMDRLKNRLNTSSPEDVPQKPETSGVKVAQPLPKTCNDVATIIPAEDIVKSKPIQPTSLLANRLLNEGLQKSLNPKRQIPVKNLNSVKSLIERLQENLGKDSLHPPPLKPLEEVDFQDVSLTSQEIIAKVGPLIVGTKHKELLYVCTMNSCMFSSRNATIFEKHCESLHNDKFWDGFCCSCDTHTGVCDIVGACQHMIKVHASPNSPKAAEENSGKGYLRMRKLSGDTLSESIVIEPVEHVLPPEQADIVQEEDHSFPFQICNVTSLADEEENTIENGSSTPLLQTNLSNILSGSSLTVIPTSGKSTPTIIPLQLLPVSSLQKITKPPGSPVNKIVSPRVAETAVKKPAPPKKIMLRDTPMMGNEALKPRKNAKAIQNMISKGRIQHLYKCPEFFCNFSTDYKSLFETHLPLHTEFAKDMMIPCLYCNFKTEYGMIGIHYDIRHSKSLHCCAYCFFRAANQSYVEYHQSITHKREPRKVILVPYNQDSLRSSAKIALPSMRTLLSSYTCGQLGCGQKFIFPVDYENHLRTNHRDTLYMCNSCKFTTKAEDGIIIHSQLHGLYIYNCGYCSFGAVSKNAIFKHAAVTHYSMTPRILIRRSNSGANNVTLQLNDKEEVFFYVTIDEEEDKKYITPGAKFEIKRLEVMPPALKQYGCQKALPKQNDESAILTKLNAGKPVTQKEDDVVQSTVVDDGEIVISDDEDTVPPPQNEVTPLPKCDATPPKCDATPPKCDVTSLPTAEVTPPIILNKFLSKSGALANVSNILSKSDVDEKRDKSDDDEQSSPFVNMSLPDKEADEDYKNKDTSTDIDPLQLDAEVLSKFSTLSKDETTSVETNSELSTESKKRIFNLSGVNLFICTTCTTGFVSSQTFKSHVMQCAISNIHTNPKPYACAHCTKAFKSTTGLLDHISIHGTQRFICVLCDFKNSHKCMLRTHMKSRHKVNNVIFCPKNPKKDNLDEDEFIVKPKMTRQNSTDEDSSTSASYDVTSKSGNKTSYKSTEIDQLPQNSIFSTEIKCGECAFQTKVRGNLLRHLQRHLTNVPVPSSAPVNPVPCLQKNEKMFDKMTNLAHSSFSDTGRMSGPKSNPKPKSGLSKEEEMALPLFVRAAERYVCGANNCKYLNQEDSLLRHHVIACHSDESFYKCTHCQEVLSSDKGVINAEYVVKHLKLHDLNLYKCTYCKFLSHLKNKVDRHVVEKHPNERPLVIVVREMDQEPGEQQTEELKEVKPWRCTMCKYRSTTKEDMISHAFNRHEVQTQYKCALCMFVSDQKSAFPDHFEATHCGEETHIIDAYHEVDVAPPSVKSIAEPNLFDTTPLWQRNRNVFKHIRGIPIDETHKLSKKSPVKATTSLDQSIEAVASGSTDGLSDPYFKTPPKKPKTLKEKKMEMSANLMDEFADTVYESKEPSKKFPKIKVKSSSNITKPPEQVSDEFVDVVGLEDNALPTLQELADMDIKELEQSNFGGIWGLFGKPLNDKYLCPQCESFSTVRHNDFKTHLYKELDYSKFACTICRMKSLSADSLRRHVEQKHNGNPQSVIALDPEFEIEDWVNKVLLVQRRLILEKSKTSSQTSSTDFVDDGSEQKALNPFKCQYCIYTCKTSSDLNKHVKRHWAQKPFKCNYCSVKGVTKYEIIQHAKRAHAHLEPIVVNVPVPEIPGIVPLSRKRKFFKTNKPSTTDTKPNIDKLESSDDSYKFDDVEENDDNVIIYMCFFCPKRCNSEDEVKEHWEIMHKCKQPVFKFKKIKASELTKRGSLYYKCFYCDVILQIDPMKVHIKKEHPGKKYSVNRFKCGYPNCNFYLRNSDILKNHFRLRHNNAEVVFRNIEKPTATTTQIQCDYCPSEFDNHTDLVQHHDQFHSHLEPKFQGQVQVLAKLKSNDLLSDEGKKYKCPQCSQVYEKYASIRDHVRVHAKPFVCGYCPTRFCYPSICKNHHHREHPNLEFKCENDPEGQKVYDNLRANILVMSDNGVYENHRYVKNLKRNRPNNEPGTSASVSSTAGLSDDSISDVENPPKKFKPTARKSTSQAFQRNLHANEEGFSYYGNKPDIEGIENVKAFLPFLESTIAVTMSQISFHNFFPKVVAVDVIKYPDKA